MLQKNISGINISLLPPIGKSDHVAILLEIPGNFEDPSRYKRFCWEKTNKMELIKFFDNINWSEEFSKKSLEKLNTFIEISNKAIDKLVPIKTVSKNRKFRADP